MKEITVKGSKNFAYYQGQFNHGVIEGRGKLHYWNGHTYEGDFNKNRIDGIGKEYSPRIKTCLYLTNIEFITEYGQFCEDFYGKNSHLFNNK